MSQEELPNVCPICGGGATSGFVDRTVEDDLRVRLACDNHEIPFELIGVGLNAVATQLILDGLHTGDPVVRDESGKPSEGSHANG